LGLALELYIMKKDIVGSNDVFSQKYILQPSLYQAYIDS